MAENDQEQKKYPEATQTYASWIFSNFLSPFLPFLIISITVMNAKSVSLTFSEVFAKPDIILIIYGLLISTKVEWKYINQIRHTKVVGSKAGGGCLSFLSTVALIYFVVSLVIEVYEDLDYSKLLIPLVIYVATMLIISSLFQFYLRLYYWFDSIYSISLQ
ncbi:MAG: hypothetical protein HUU38_04155 [Anaerolineales bacterium]|nr:hypothetical protein [Anaerolineales bacterium]